jgi:hypothetical protein
MLSDDLSVDTLSIVKSANLITFDSLFFPVKRLYNSSALSLFPKALRCPWGAKNKEFNSLLIYDSMSVSKK